jgi:hypothetical protein
VTASARWDDDRLRRELGEFLASYEEWPSYREFQRRGRKHLRDVVTRCGGARGWAAELGLPYPERRPGYAVRWTEDRIRSELADFLRGREVWPSRLEFERAGRKPLRDAVGRTGGPKRWAREFQLAMLNERSGSKRVWTDERIERELRRFLRGRSEWPTRSEFKSAGLGSLVTAVNVRGGSDHWARRLGVRKPRRHGPPTSRRWTDARIREELRAFCAGRPSWPRYREFEAAGQGPLYRAASMRGGVERWKRELGAVVEDW